KCSTSVSHGNAVISYPRSVSVIEEERTMEASSTEKRIDELSGRFGRFETDVRDRFDRVDRRFERFEDKVDARFDKLEGRFDRWGKIVAGGVVTAAAAVVAKTLGA